MINNIVTFKDKNGSYINDKTDLEGKSHNINNNEVIKDNKNIYQIGVVKKYENRPNVITEIK